MPDESIRALEHALGAAPDDGALRLRLVQALARAGRRSDAIARLDLARVPEDTLPEARSLSSALWREELAGLSLRRTIPGTVVSLLAVSDALVAWSGQKGLVVADLETGETRLTDPRYPGSRVFAGGDSIFAYDTERFVLTVVDPEGGIQTTNLADRPKLLLSVSPRADRLLLADDRRAWVRRWPGLELVCERRVHGQPWVDWHSGNLMARNSVGLIEVAPLAGGFTSFLDVPGQAQLQLLERGIVSELGDKGALHGLAGRWRLELFPVSEGTAPPSVEGETGVRYLLGDRPFRLEVDLERGKLLSAPPGVESAAIAKGVLGALWHPHADLVLRSKRSYGGFDMVGLDGAVLASWKDGMPFRWSEDGRTLVVYAQSKKKEPRIEVWRTLSAGAS